MQFIELKVKFSCSGDKRQTIENMVYYDADISRVAAAKVLEHGGKHSFLIRARKGAPDCSQAPFVRDSSVFTCFQRYPKTVSRILLIALTIKGRDQVYHAKINHHRVEDKYYLGKSGSPLAKLTKIQLPQNDSEVLTK